MKKTAKNRTAKFQFRMTPDLLKTIMEIAEEKNKTNKSWSMTDELNLRVEQSLKVPPDILAACEEMGDVTDRLDFAVRLLRRAGMNVSIPGDAE